jgi:hypothetical protein
VKPFIKFMAMWAPLGAAILRPATALVRAGSKVVLAVEHGGDGWFTYQWFRNGQRIRGGVGPALIVANACERDAGNYSVRVSNRDGSVVSNPEALRLTL